MIRSPQTISLARPDVLHELHLSIRQPRKDRGGKILVFFAILLPSLVAILGLIFDGGLLVTEQYVQQHATDAAATAAAVDIQLGNDGEIESTANSIARQNNRLPNLSLSVFRPPTQGPFAGDDQYVEVIGRSLYRTKFIRLPGGLQDSEMRTRAVAGLGTSTPGAAIAVLDPSPAPLTIPSLTFLGESLDSVATSEMAMDSLDLPNLISTAPSLLKSLIAHECLRVIDSTIAETLEGVTAHSKLAPLPSLTAGLEIEGLGTLQVDGSIHVNNTWGGVDEDGERAGIGHGPPHAVACMPLLSTTCMHARHLRVVGGVDKETNYLPMDANGRDPLRANQLPVPDPLDELPVPSSESDLKNVGIDLTGYPHLVDVVVSPQEADAALDKVSGLLSVLLGDHLSSVRDKVETALSQSVYRPGVYDSLTVIAPAGGVKFEPGIYIIKSKNPITQLSLCLLGPIQANGVMFYVTDNDNFDSTSGFPDQGTSSEKPPLHVIADLLPSVVISPLIGGGSYTGLNDPSSPFNEMLIYQDRNDRRPIILEGQQLIGSSSLAGTIYAKWGHTLFVGGAGSYDLKIASGTARFITLGDTRIAPSTLFSAATDILLVE